MKEYHKIQTVFKRDEKNNFKTLLEGEYSMPEFEYLKDNQWECTEKIDGTNIRVMWDGKDVVFGGKTDNAQIPSFLLSKLMDLFCRGNKMKENFPDGCCLYGEGYGAKIQKGGGNYISDGVDFILFDVKIGEWWLKREDVIDVAKNLNIDKVPIVGVGNLAWGIEKVKEGFNSFFGDFKAEGLVMRPCTQLFNRKGERVITKIKYKDFIKE